MIFIDLIYAIRGILKRRKVESMLCAQYSYKMDIAVKKEEAFKEGVAEGAQQKAKNALALNLSPEITSKISGLPMEQILELQKSIPAKA